MEGKCFGPGSGGGSCWTRLRETDVDESGARSTVAFLWLILGFGPRALQLFWTGRWVLIWLEREMSRAEVERGTERVLAEEKRVGWKTVVGRY